MSRPVSAGLPFLLAAGVALAGTAFAQDGPAEPPVVWILATGGTISGGGTSSTSLTEYQPGAFSGEELVAAVPALADHATIRVEQIANVGSPNITFNDWLTLANRINTIFRDDPDVAGVVITHGTNTLEETAYFLNLTVRHGRPVVLVGSQRPATAISSDGPLNLLNAVRTAAAPEARGKGVLVVLNDEINAARDVTKTSTYRVETFRSRELGFLGYVDGDQVTFYRQPTRRHTFESEFDVSRVTRFPRVDIVYSYVEPNPLLINALIDDGVDGIVLAGTGAGLVSGREREALARVVDLPPESRPVIVRSSRTGSGRVVPLPSYDEAGMVAGDTLSPQKARILLMLALAKTRDQEEIRRIFREY
ncbi:MAG: asparaginase [Acidobacteria bacterium]|nr:asparaginase [Acidobacteriota bacterium]